MHGRRAWISLDFQHISAYRFTIIYGIPYSSEGENFCRLVGREHFAEKTFTEC